MQAIQCDKSNHSHFRFQRFFLNVSAGHWKLCGGQRVACGVLIAHLYQKKLSLQIVLFTWPLQQIMFDWRQNRPSTVFTSWGKTDTTVLQRWLDSAFLLSYPNLFLKSDIRIRSESCFGWNHTVRIRKLSEDQKCIMMHNMHFCVVSILPCLFLCLTA